MLLRDKTLIVETILAGVCCVVSRLVKAGVVLAASLGAGFLVVVAVFVEESFLLGIVVELVLLLELILVEDVVVAVCLVAFLVVAG